MGRMANVKGHHTPEPLSRLVDSTTDPEAEGGVALGACPPADRSLAAASVLPDGDVVMVTPLVDDTCLPRQPSGPASEARLCPCWPLQVTCPATTLMVLWP